MNDCCLKNCRGMIVENEHEIELRKFRGVSKLSWNLLGLFRFEADLAGQCDYYFNECVEVPAIVFCEKVGINYFNSSDMYADVAGYIDENRDIIEDELYDYIKDGIILNDYTIVVGNYLSCHSDLFKDAGNCVGCSKEEVRIREFAIDFVHNVVISVAYRYLWSCIYGSQRKDFHYFKI